MLCERCRHEIEETRQIADPVAAIRELNLDELPSMPLGDYLNLPMLSAVYFAISGDTVCYVGQARELGRRWRHHDHLERFQLVGGRIAWLALEIEHLKQAEKEAIRRFRPLWNLHGPDYKKYVQIRDYLTAIRRVSLPHEVRLIPQEVNQ